jgi:hypothetical protein
LLSNGFSTAFAFKTHAAECASRMRAKAMPGETRNGEIVSPSGL